MTIFNLMDITLISLLTSRNAFTSKFIATSKYTHSVKLTLKNLSITIENVMLEITIYS